MEVVVNDSTFGEMTYKRRWFKEEEIVILGKQQKVLVVAKAFSGKPINDEQRATYRWFNENHNQIEALMYQEASEYINSNCHVFAQYWNGARMVNCMADVAQILIPRTVLYKPDGSLLILFDCPWDDHGVAIQLKPSVVMGSQDMFL